MSLEHDQYFDKSEEELWEEFTQARGIARADICIALGNFAYKKGNHMHSLALCETARDLYESEGLVANSGDLVQAYIGIAYSREGLNQPKEAAEAAHEAAKFLSDTDLSATAEMFRYESRVWFQAEDYERSIKCSEKAQRQLDQEVTNHKIGTDYFNIAIASEMLGRWLKAVKNFRQARLYFQKDRDPIGVAYCDEELSQCLIQRNQGLAAEYHAQLALDYANTALDNNRQRVSNYYLGMAKKVNGDFKGAEKCLRDAQYMITVGGEKDWPLLIKIEKELAQIYRQTDRTEEADEILRRLRAIEDTFDQNHLPDGRTPKRLPS